eukprot:4111711-Pleurochrysis_carterae.AAC.2
MCGGERAREQQRNRIAAKAQPRSQLTRAPRTFAEHGRAPCALPQLPNGRLKCSFHPAPWPRRSPAWMRAAAAC